MQKTININNPPIEFVLSAVADAIGGIHIGFWNVPQKKGREKVYVCFEIDGKPYLVSRDSVKCRGAMTLRLLPENVPANAYFYHY